MTTTQAYIQTWEEARTRFTNLLRELKAEDLAKKLMNTKNSAGFLIRHICSLDHYVVIRKRFVNLVVFFRMVATIVPSRNEILSNVAIWDANNRVENTLVRVPKWPEFH